MRTPPPIGSAVSYQGRLGRVMRRTPSQRLSWMRSLVPVVLDGDDEINAIDYRNLSYVASKYETAKQWEQLTARRATLAETTDHLELEDMEQ